MIEEHVAILLSTWERASASLAACRAALEASHWDAELALAALAAPSAQSRATAAAAAASVSGAVRDASPEAAARLVSAYKVASREHDRMSPGTLPRSLVWASARAAHPSLERPPWHRHRFFLGAPYERFVGSRDAASRALSLGGHVRFERDASDAPRASRQEEALLAHRDVRWVLDRLVHFARTSGLHVAVELHGKMGWLDGAGCDATIDAACERLLAIDGVSTTEMKAAARRLTREEAWAILDRHPNHRANVKDCGWATVIEANLLRAARILREVDLDLDLEGAEGATEPTAATIAREVEAGSKRSLHALLVARARYQTTGSATFTDVLDRLLLEHGSNAIGPVWREISRAEAVATWQAALTKTLAYGTPLLEASAAERVALAYAASFERDALFFGDGYGGLGTTLETGVGVVDSSSAGLFFVGDED